MFFKVAESNIGSAWTSLVIFAKYLILINLLFTVEIAAMDTNHEMLVSN